MKWQDIYRRIEQRPGRVILVSALLAVLGLVFTIRLYSNLRPDIEELLPKTARSVQDLSEVRARLDGVDLFSILVFSDDIDASRKFVDALGKRLQLVPKDIIAKTDYRVGDVSSFFKKNRYLYMQNEDLVRLRDYMKKRLDYEIELYNPLNIFRTTELEEPTMDFYGLQEKYQNQSKGRMNFPGGYYSTRDEKIRALLLYLPTDVPSRMKGAKALKQAVDQAIAEIDPKKYSNSIEIHFTGPVQALIEEQAALVADLGISTSAALFLVAILMLLFFRNFYAVSVLVTSLFMGTLWTFGIAYFVVGYLNSNTAFLASIVLGNGVNFGIMFLSRYLEERKSGRSHLEGMLETVRGTWSGTWIAALAAGVSYGALFLTDFRGFQQFGIIGLMGMVLCWLSAFVTFPSLLSVLEKKGKLRIGRDRALEPTWIGKGLTAAVRKMPEGIVGLSLLLTAASFWISYHHRNDDFIESDISKVRSEESEVSGAGFYQKYLTQVFERNIAPMVLLADSADHAKRIAAKLREDLRPEGPLHGLVESIWTLDQLVPKNQSEKLETLKEIGKLFGPRIRTRLPKERREEMEPFLNANQIVAIQAEDLPADLTKRFRERDGSLGRLVLVEPPGDDSILKGDRLNRVVNRVREVADSVEPNVPIAGQILVAADIVNAIKRDGPKATIAALVAVSVVVMLLIRNFVASVILLTSMGLGVVWLFGAMFTFGIKINFINFITLPITFGISVDYGVNLLQRYRTDQERDVLLALRETGAAILLASLTTIIGYGSLILARNRGFVSFGIIAVLGEVTCLIAALLTLPSVLLIREELQKDGGLR